MSFKGPEEEVPTAETHRETIEIQHEGPKEQEIPESTRVTQTYQIEHPQPEEMMVPEETTHTQAVRIDKQMVIQPEQRTFTQTIEIDGRPKKPQQVEIRVGVPKTTPVTTQVVKETTTFTTITSQAQVCIRFFFF